MITRRTLLAAPPLAAANDTIHVGLIASTSD